MIKILIVDDHVLFREGLAVILGRESGLQVLGMAGTVAEAVEMTRSLNPDVVMMDFSLPDGTGADAARAILAELPDCKIIFLSMSESTEDLLEAVRSGAKGYLSKNLRPQNLLSAIESVYAGESAISRSMTLQLMNEIARTAPSTKRGVDPRLAKLTARELDVLVEISNNLSSAEISEKLFISPNTLKSYIHSILDKLNLPDRKAAAQFALEYGLVRRSSA